MFSFGCGSIQKDMMPPQGIHVPKPVPATVWLGADNVPEVSIRTLRIRAERQFAEWTSVDQFRIDPKNPADNLQVICTPRHGFTTCMARPFKREEVGKKIPYNIIITRAGVEYPLDPDIEVIE